MDIFHLILLIGYEQKAIALGLENSIQCYPIRCKVNNFSRQSQYEGACSEPHEADRRDLRIGRLNINASKLMGRTEQDSRADS
jgi:hypothetical protein